MTWYVDEIQIHANDLAGLTVTEAIDLKRHRDLEYLMS